MADLSTVYSLSTPGGTVLFNNGDLHGIVDLYWIQTIAGLNGAPIRTPMDNAPQAHGGLVYNFWKGPRHVGLEGFIIVRSVPFNSAECQEVLNGMEDDLTDALESILQADGTLSWTPAGGSGRSLSVRCEIPFDPQPAENYAVRTFTVGLVAADPDY